MNIKEGTIGEFFKQAFDVNYTNMLEDSFIDVRDKNIGVLSFDKKLNKNIYKRVNKIIRKNDTNGYRIIFNKNEFICSKEHRLAIKFDLKEDFAFIEIGDLLKIKDKYYLLTQDNVWEKFKIEKTNKIFPILDLEVEDTACFYTNGILSHNSYGNPETVSGGVSLTFYSSIRLEVRRKEVIGDKEDPDGFVTKIKVAKNKCGPPFRIAEVDLYIGKNGIYGIDNYSEIVNLAVSNSIIQKAGAWYKYVINGNEERWQGKHNLIVFLKDNDSIFEEIKNQVFNLVLNKSKPIEGSMQDVVDKKKRNVVKDEPQFEEINEDIKTEDK